MIELVLPLPPSVNHIYRRTETGMQVLKDNVKRFRAEVHARVLEQAMYQLMPAPPYKLCLTVVMAPTKRRKDLDNCLKATIDALTGSLGFDDNDITEIQATKRYERGCSECLVTIDTA